MGKLAYPGVSKTPVERHTGSSPVSGIMNPTVGEIKLKYQNTVYLRSKLMENDFVTAAGIGFRNNRLCFIVSVSRDSVKLDLPDTVENLPVVVEINTIERD